MVTGIQNLYDQRARIIEQMKATATKAATEGRAMSEEELTSWRKMEADESALTSSIQANEALEALEARNVKAKFENAPKAADKGKQRDYVSAYELFVRKGWHEMDSESRSILREKRGTSNQVVGTDSLGGYLVPDTWQPEIERAMKSYSGILQACRILQTSTGETRYWPTEDDTSTKAVKVGEASAFTVQDLTLGQAQLDAYKYGSIMKVSYELLQDNAYNIERELRDAFAPRFGRALNEQCTIGDGSGDPNGVVTASTLGKTAASATAFTYLEILDLKHSIDPAYRANPDQFGFMFHDNVLLAIKKLVDSQNRPLWMPSYVAGEPDRIDGTRFWVNQDMDSSINASSKLILCGDFSKYIVRIAQDMIIARRDELYSESGLVGFQAWMRFDGECINTAAIKHLITAAS
jgi:HK97 family phage major capsid protein